MASSSGLSGRDGASRPGQSGIASGHRPYRLAQADARRADLGEGIVDSRRPRMGLGPQPRRAGLPGGPQRGFVMVGRGQLSSTASEWWIRR